MWIWRTVSTRTRPRSREMDVLLATGEQVSISLLAMAIETIGVPVISLDRRPVRNPYERRPQAGTHRRDRYDAHREGAGGGTDRHCRGFPGHQRPARYHDAGTRRLDTSAVAVAAALKADACEIYTDVDGVFNADPRMVPHAKKLNMISYEEVLEMASLGAGVLHPRSVELAENLICRSASGPATMTTKGR